MVYILSLELDADAKTCLDNYRKVRDRFMHELNEPRKNACEYLPQHLDAAALDLKNKLAALSPHSPEIILAEVSLRRNDSVLCVVYINSEYT